jgi:hypothetical protein
MRIQFIYFDNNPGFVDPESLEELIKTRRIIAFGRADGSGGPPATPPTRIIHLSISPDISVITSRT